jgi:prepilin-type N-terminal cleavage/methylation domain
MNNLLRKKTNELTKKKKKGFTLVELIIVIAIIAILAAMAIPKLSAMKNSAKVSNDVAAAKNIGTIAATLVSDGTIATPTADVDVSSSTAIKNRLDGKASSGLTEATGAAFHVVVTDKGGVEVRVGSSTGTILYPDDGTGRKAYAATVS